MNLLAKARQIAGGQLVSPTAATGSTSVGKKDTSAVASPRKENPIQEIEYPDGSYYTGGVKSGARDGQGKLVYANGDVYEGGWKTDARHGEGTVTINKTHTYAGQWKDDKQHGKGVETFPTGDTYEGGYSLGKMSGFGILRYAPISPTDAVGNVYIGQWRDDKKHGQGKMLYSNGDVFIGNWSAGKREGQGITAYGSVHGPQYASQWKSDILVNNSMNFVPDHKKAKVELSNVPDDVLRALGHSG